MRILVADDDPVSRRLLEATLRQCNCDVCAVADGQQAWETLQSPGPAPQLLILDWLMPEIDGVELCRRVRANAALRCAYIIVLTSRGGRPDVVAGLEAGADDYVVKPFDPDELRARVQVGVRVLNLQRALAERVKDLEDALQRVTQLQGLLPICCYCKRIRDDRNYWHQVESYIAERTEVSFTHSLCPVCFKRRLREIDVPA